MTQVKILVNNIHDVTHRSSSEMEINVYLKTGWKIKSTHQHINPDNGILTLTTILEKEGGEKTEVKEPVKAVEATTPKENADAPVKDKAEIKEGSEEKKEESEQKEPQAKKETTEEESETKEETPKQNETKE